MERKVLLRAAYAYDTNVASDEAGLRCDDPSLAQQQFKDECDINEIVRRFGLTGQMPEAVAMPVTGDFTSVVDFHSALNLVRQAEAGFMELPAEMRSRFDNDPGKLLAFLDDERNRDEAVKLGLVVKPPEKTRDVVTAIDELAAKMQVR